MARYINIDIDVIGVPVMRGKRDACCSRKDLSVESSSLGDSGSMAHRTLGHPARTDGSSAPTAQHYLPGDFKTLLRSLSTSAVGFVPLDTGRLNIKNALECEF